MNEFLYGLTIIILIAVVIALKRERRRIKRGTCSKTEFHIGEGIMFSHTSCVNPEPVKPPAALYIAPQQPINAICPTFNPLATRMEDVGWRGCQTGGMVGNGIDFLEERNRAMSQQLSLLLELNVLRAKLKTPTTPEERIEQAKDFLHDAQMTCAKPNVLIDANNTSQGGNHP